VTSTGDWVQVIPDSTGKKIDADELYSPCNYLVYRQRIQLGGTGLTEIAKVTNTHPNSADYALVVRPLTGAISPRRSADVLTDLAPASSGDIDSSNILAGKTGKLIHVIVSSSVAFKVSLRTVESGITSLAHVVAFSYDRVWEFKAPDINYLTLDYTGISDDKFRVTVTNLDTSDSADFYATFFWDEG